MTGTSRIPRAPADRPAAAPSGTRSAADKTALRRLLAARRNAIGAADKAAHDARIGAHLLAWWQGQAQTHAPGPLDSLAVYWPLPGEVDLSASYAALAAQGVQLALPVVVEKHAALGFAAWTPGEAMQRDAMGVAVPASLRMLALPPALLVPCLGFDARRYRLGYGGGYYDRTLAALPRPLTVGIAYACQQAEFASFAHDVALDLVLTEQGTL